jgi:radical SAM protein with 4Fe4S-binding SPASM domain
MNVTPETRLALDPQICLRNDVDRAVLITRPKPLADKTYLYRLVPPAEAVILALMDGDRTLRELGDLWADLTGRPPEAGAFEVGKVVEYYTTGDRERNGFLIEVDDGNRAGIRRYDPMDFVIPAARVNVKDSRMRRPYMVYYLPTLFCPQKCIYCYAHTCPKPENDLISLERLRQIFAELAGLGVEVIQMSGGEVFARKDIFDVIAAIFEAGMTVDIPTKLGLNYEQALKLKELGVPIVQVSLDSTDPAILEQMVGVKNYHLRIFKVLDDLRRAEMEVRVNAVLTPINLPTVGPLLDYLGGLGNVTRVSLTPYGRSLFCHSDELFVSPEDLEGVMAEIASRKALYPHMLAVVTGGGVPEPTAWEEKMSRWKGRAFCTANRHGFVILPDGRVTVCEELYDHPEFVIGDLKRQSVMEMWNSPQALALLHPDQSAVPAGPCKSCEAFDECNSYKGRCWRDVLKSYGWDKPYYPDPRCPWAPEGNRLS